MRSYKVHKIFPSMILKKPPLLKWLYFIKYSFAYPCKKCIIRVTCIEACLDLAKFSYTYNLITDFMDDILESVESRKRKNEKHIIYRTISNFFYWELLIIFGVICGFIIALLSSTGINFIDGSGNRKGPKKPVELRFDNVTNEYFR